MNFEVTLNGFDGGTDETDHLVKWISASDLAMVESYLELTGLKSHVQGVIEIQKGTPLTFADGIDVILEDHSCSHDDELQICSDLFAYSIEPGNTPTEWINESLSVLI